MMTVRFNIRGDDSDTARALEARMRNFMMRVNPIPPRLVEGDQVIVGGKKYKVERVEIDFDKYETFYELV